MLSFENRYDAARNKFFAENPRAMKEVEAVSAGGIEACGMTVEEYRQVQRVRVFAEAAEKRGIEMEEFVIQLVAESPKQAQEWRIQRHRQMADALGIDWAEYRAMNKIAV